ncbi:MAG: PQQ-binding-like beta-propeller repeat protein [Bryobacteraceae bacterium]
MKAFCAIFGLSVLLLAAVPDWLNSGGDPQRSGWQKRDRYITRDSLPKFQLLWKLKLDNESREANTLTAPVIYGPIITHRGMKELVFIAGASDNVYAVDADLGRLFWKRHFETSRDGCAGGLTAAPVLAPQVSPNDAYEDPTPPRPLYVLTSDGNLHTLRTTNGLDYGPPVKFLAPNARASNLNFAGTAVHTTTSGGCGGVPDGLWALDVTSPDAKPRFTAAKGTGVASGFDGTIHTASIPFQWKGRELFLSTAFSPALAEARGLATWVDSNGIRWVYAALPRGISAFRLTGPDALEPAWTSQAMNAPVAPVIVNGMVFALSTDTAVLYALEGATGKELYSSGKTVTSAVNSSGLALANGHVCFGTADNTLYCFGIPTDI